MPFQEDTDIDESALDSPTWGAFTLLGRSVEKLVPINLVWAMQVIPALLAFLFPQLPLVVRFVMVCYTVVGLAVGTGVMYAVVSELCQDEPPTLEMLRSSFRKLTRPALKTLVPLFMTLVICIVAVIVSSFTDQILLEAVVIYLALMLLITSLYWGPVFVEYPDKSAFFMMKRSTQLVLRYPLPSLLTGVLSLVLFIVGSLSVVGFGLIVPVLIGVLQTRRYQDLAVRERQRRGSKAIHAEIRA